MGHHIDAEGRFQSDKHPGLPPDRIRLNIANPRSARGLLQLAEDYREIDSGLADDLRQRVLALHPLTSPNLDQFFKFKIGEVLAHATDPQPAPRPKLKDPTDWAGAFTVRYHVVERCLQECHGGVQEFYLCRNVSPHGSVGKDWIKLARTELAAVVVHPEPEDATP